MASITYQQISIKKACRYQSHDPRRRSEWGESTQLPQQHDIFLHLSDFRPWLRSLHCKVLRRKENLETALKTEPAVISVEQVLSIPQARLGPRIPKARLLPCYIESTTCKKYAKLHKPTCTMYIFSRKENKSAEDEVTLGSWCWQSVESSEEDKRQQKRKKNWHQHTGTVYEQPVIWCLSACLRQRIAANTLGKCRRLGTNIWR